MKKSLTASVLLCLMVSLSACRTTTEERVKIGTLAGAAIGAGIGAIGGGSVLPGIAAGAAAGATIGLLAE